MNKSLLAIATATCALATITSSAAEAGFKIHFGFGHFGGFHDYHYSQPRYVVVRPVQPRVYVARKAKPVAKDEPETVAAANNENSSIAIASADVADGQAPDSADKTVVKSDKTADAALQPAKVADAAVESGSQPAKKLDCKKFFPTVGLTLTAPCE